MKKINKINLSNSNLHWLEESTIILAPTGSYAYGTNTEESDRDYKGVCIPPIDYYLGLERFDQYVNKSDNIRNTKDDVDITIYSINKFVRDAMNGSPNNIELLFMGDNYIKITDLGEVLIENRHLFISKQVFNRYGGYARGQTKRLKAKKDFSREDVKKYGYATKEAMHTIRLLTSAIEILETEDFSTYRPNRKLLLDIRNGKYTFDEVIEMIEHYDNELNQVLEVSGLSKKPDYNTINEMLIDINKNALF